MRWRTLLVTTGLLVVSLTAANICRRLIRRPRVGGRGVCAGKQSSGREEHARMNRPMFYPAVEVSAQQITAWLESGASVVLPTETVYGLAAKAGNPQSADRLCRLKGRPADMNLPVVIGGIHQLSALGVDFNRTAQVLAKVFWPGPLTLVLGFSASGARPAWLSGRIEVAGLLPAHPLLPAAPARPRPLLLFCPAGARTGARPDAREAVQSPPRV